MHAGVLFCPISSIVLYSVTYMIWDKNLIRMRGVSSPFTAPSVLFFFLFIGSPGNWTQGLKLARHAPPPQPLLFLFVFDRHSRVLSPHLVFNRSSILWLLAHTWPWSYQLFTFLSQLAWFMSLKIPVLSRTSFSTTCVAVLDFIVAFTHLCEIQWCLGIWFWLLR
jgi:hypothetical protein